MPPTVALCREHFGMSAGIVFGWVFASHQIGAAFASTLAGVAREAFGDYALAWYAAGALSIRATLLSLGVRSATAGAKKPELVGA